jgi:nitric oxide synthase oxygenase domain/subunit
VADRKVFTNLFNGNSGNNPFELPSSRNSAKMFAITTLINNKLNQQNSILEVVTNLENIVFKCYDYNGYSFVNNFTKTRKFIISNKNL